MDTSIYSKSDKELLDWEFSLENTDLRAQGWYHGNCSRLESESLLESEGDFLVRDSSTFSKTGDYVLSTCQNGIVLHFLIHKEVIQPNTVYEQLGYRFENESFTSLIDLITYYVGNAEKISLKSQAIIIKPIIRTVPISRKNRIYPQLHEEHADYVTIAQEVARQVLPVEALLIEKSFTPESLNQVSLNLTPPPDLLESLEEIPEKIRNLDVYKNCVSFEANSNEGLNSNFDLANFSSILLPMKLDDVAMNPSLIEQINSRILEASEKLLSYHLTEVDWKTLKRESLRDDSPDEEGPTCPKIGNQLSEICENLLHDKQFRRNHIIERSITFSHFVALSVLGAEDREGMIHKWIKIAQEVKTGTGNFFAFCNIMRGLTCSKINTAEPPIDWFKLRREFTQSAFLFETSQRNAYQSLLQGTESYPPNTTIPDLFPVAIILDDDLQLFPQLNSSIEQDKLKSTVAHLRQFKLFCENESIYARNWKRIQEDSNIPIDIILADVCRTETQLLLLWGVSYNSKSLLERCKHFDK